MLFPHLIRASKKNPVTNIKVRIIFQLQLWNIHSLNQIFTARLSYYFSVHGVQNDDYYYKRTLRHQTMWASKYRKNLYQRDLTTNCVFIFHFHSNSKHSSNYDTFCITVFIYSFTSTLYVKGAIMTKALQRNTRGGMIVNRTGWICC